MDAHLATRCFYLARVPIPSHKTTLPSPSYSPPTIVPFLPPLRLLLLAARTESVRHFRSPWKSCNRCTAWLRYPPYPLLWDPRSSLCAVSFGRPSQYVFFDHPASSSVSTWNLTTPTLSPIPSVNSLCIRVTHGRFATVS
jgi:hypothetical protein